MFPGRPDGSAAGQRRPHIKSRDLAIALARVAAENRCRDVLVLDLTGMSPVTDYFVVATGTSRRQMRTVVQKMADYAKEHEDGGARIGKEGMESERWALVDLFDVVAHVFAPDARSYYAIELLWGDAPKLDWAEGWMPPQAADEEDF